jgi:hypothetical protein
MRRRPLRSPAIADSADSAGLEPGEDALGVPDQRLACGGQADSARMALEQRHAGFRLERRDLLGDGRLRVGQRLGRAGEGSPVSDLSEDSESSGVKHKYILYHRSQISLELMAGTWHNRSESTHEPHLGEPILVAPSR